MPAPVTFEHYEVLTRADGSLHELGRGAMGITYKCFDTMLRVPVALKVVNAVYLESDSARQRFVREARAAAQLRHRNVASVFHLGEEGGNYFYVMEFIDGETVEALVKRQGPLGPVFALRIVAQVARALNAAQLQDLVHRDIKPSNLMAVVEDDDLVIKVIDFGLAKALFGDSSSTGAALTHGGGFVGTPQFASPEQLEDREVDARSDIYSLGITLWYLLRGAPPFHGSMARVIGQHLSAPPPFEELDAFPQAVVDLLGRMLAKDPAERPQTPAQLRKEVEHCLSLLAGPIKTRAALSATPQSTAPSVPFVVASDGAQLETGVTLAQRYLITEELDENEAGTSFVARDLRQSSDVRLLALHSELIADRECFGKIEREAGTVATLAHPNVLEVFGLTTSGSNAFLTLGSVNGFTLRDLLRVRRELPPEEVCQILAPAAAGLDHALAHLPRLELGLHHVLVDFPGHGEAVDELLAQSIPRWPDFVIKINPLATWRDIFALTWAAGQTAVGAMGRQEQKATSSRAAAIQAFGAIAYELLGGVAAGSPARNYSPLADLDEAGNVVLRRALIAPDSFASASEFVQQLSTPASAQPAAMSPASVASVAPPHTPELVVEPSPPPIKEGVAPPVFVDEPPPGAPPHRRILIPVAIFLLATGAAYLISRTHPRAPEPPLTLTTPAPVIEPSTPSSLARLTTPGSVPSSPPRLPPVTPPLPPSRRDLASDARRAAEAFETKQQSHQALSAWLRMARDFPEFDAGRLGVELLLSHLRRRPGGLTRAEFASMRPEIGESAKLGVVSAMLILGDALRETDPKQAFAWYCTAAEGGDPLAMTQAGLMLSNGAGAPRDLGKAAAFLQMATDQGDPAATHLLAECYLDGKGVAKDPKRAVVLLRKAVARGNIRATNRLGWCYHKGIGLARDPHEAFRLFSEAAEGGSAEAIGNLGALYMNGEGVEKNEIKGVEKFKEASLKGDPTSMFYYAGCLESGQAVKANAEAAKKLFQKAAGAGQAEAIEWCKSHNVPPNPNLDVQNLK